MLLAISETWYMFALCVAIALAAWFVFIWAVRSGQFKDTEQTARDMLELDAHDKPLPPKPVAGSGAAKKAGDEEAESSAPSGTLGGHAVESGRERQKR